MNQPEVLISGKTSFKIEVPYKLLDQGAEGKKPLIVYLHGFNQNIDTFQQQVAGLLELEAYHLFIQGPYPIYERDNSRRVEDWGRAWYLYDGEQSQFVKSMELSSEFIQEIIDNTLKHIEVSRLCVFGYSMGAYLAGYFALSRWKHVNELVMIGGRLKTEIFEDRDHHYDHLNVLALHGKNDKSVKAGPQRECIEQLEKWGAHVTFRQLDATHRLSKIYIQELCKWLTLRKYQKT